MLTANQDKFQDKFMGTLAAAEGSEINVLDYAINRLDQKDYRHRLRAALAELDLDQATSKKLKAALKRWELL